MHPNPIHYKPILQRPEFYKNLIESKIKKSNDCWLWDGTGRRSKYGRIVVRGHYLQAHRVSWMVNFGEIPESLYVCHSCDVKLCVNPDHLFLGTAKDNAEDAVLKNLYLSGEDHHFAKITKETVLAMRREFAPGNTNIIAKKIRRQK